MKNCNRAFEEACKIIGGQRAMANALGIDESFVSQIINGKRNLPIPYGLRIEELTGVSRKELFPSTWFNYWSDL